MRLVPGVRFVGKWFSRCSVRTRIMGWTSLLVVVVVAGLLGLLLHGQHRAFRTITSTVAGLTQDLQAEQQQAVQRIGARQESNAAEALKAKGTSLVNMMARLAPVPLLTFEIETLNDYCGQVCADRDVVLCYVANAQQQIQTGFRNPEDKALTQLVGDADERSVGELADALRDTDRVLELNKDVVQDGQTIGQVVLLLSKQGMIEQKAQIKADFGQLDAGMQTLLTSLEQDLEAGMDEESQSSLTVGLLAGLIAVVLGAVAAGRIALTISRPLRQSVDVLEAVAAGDLSQRLELDRHDELGRMAAALNVAVAASAETLDEVKAAAERENQRQQEEAEQQHKRMEAEREKARQMQAQVDHYLDVLEQVAKGDYSHKITVAGDDAIRRLGEGLETFVADKQTAETRQAEMARRERQQAEQLRAKVDDLLDVVAAATEGDLTRKVNVEGDEAIDELAGSINQMLFDLSGIISQVTESTAQFMEGSRVIAESSQSLAAGAQTQSSSVEEVTASVEELTASIDGVKTNASEADTVAKRTNELAESGGQAVKKSIEAMELIRTSSDQIAEIIQVISEIASQTNLLALNAAIEAARAGEHGMGFAVVADEVRKLAERSNQAAGEITSLIKESSDRVQEGAQLSDETGDALKEIIGGVEETVAKITQIATATAEQAANAQQVSEAIHGISQVTEQAATGSEQMAASSEELGAQANGLRELVARFRTDQ